MTDGILLAEIAERSLALEGLRHHHRRRGARAQPQHRFPAGLSQAAAAQAPPDLKIIVTSATIDADRFARHFESSKGPAPVLTVSGRLYPVEQRYRPFEESREYDLNNAITDAVDELWREGGGDVLVFLPGEREIRDAADHAAQAPPARRRSAAVVRAAVARRAGQGLRAARPAPHRACDQRGRDLADGAGHPLRHRPGPGAREAL
jgi:HrpA-like RNA helicase